MGHWHRTCHQKWQKYESIKRLQPMVTYSLQKCYAVSGYLCCWQWFFCYHQWCSKSGKFKSKSNPNHFAFWKSNPNPNPWNFICLKINPNPNPHVQNQIQKSFFKSFLWTYTYPYADLSMCMLVNIQYFNMENIIMTISYFLFRYVSLKFTKSPVFTFFSITIYILGLIEITWTCKPTKIHR